MKVAHHKSIEATRNPRNDETTFVQQMPDTCDPSCSSSTCSAFCGHFLGWCSGTRTLYEEVMRIDIAGLMGARYSFGTK